MSTFTYYLAADSCSGYTSLFDDLSRSARKIIILRNITKKAKDNLFGQITDILGFSSVNYDIIMHCGTSDEIDAVYLPEISTLISAEEIFSGEIPLYADVIDFARHISGDYEALRILDNIKKQIKLIKCRMYHHLYEAKLIHDRWEKIYISNMDFKALDKAADDFIEGIFANCPESPSASAQNVNRFFGTLLPRGNVNYINRLTSGLTKRVFIKGRPGTGKSTFLKKIRSAANDRGFSTETYLCSLDPKSLDMVIIRELGLAVFDSTPPHEIFPSDDRDSVFDIYDIAVKSDTDQVCSDELMRITADYNQEIKKAKECLYTCQMLKSRADVLLSDEASVNEAVQKVMAMTGLK